MINYILYQIYNLQVWLLRVSDCGDEWGYSSNFYDEKENNYAKNHTRHFNPPIFFPSPHSVLFVWKHLKKTSSTKVSILY